MSEDRLVTLQTFQHPIEARVALVFLEEQGIRAILSDEEVAGMNWALGNAIGGVKLQVLAKDAERAVALLNEKQEINQSATDHPPQEEFSEVDETALQSNPAEAPPSERELLADRACRGALFGILLIPLQLWVFALLVRVFVSNDRLREPHRMRAWVAAFVNLPYFLLIIRFVYLMLIEIFWPPNSGAYSLVR